MPLFHEDWYSDGQCRDLVQLATKVKDLNGLVIEIGCWEGKSTISLANAVYPDQLVCNDTWEGNIAESYTHATVQILKTRDVFKTFVQNMSTSTQGNYSIVREDCLQWLKSLNQPVKFCHIDASHDYTSVKKTIELLLPHVVPGGILCGDDFMNSSMNSPGLGGGVEGAVRDTLPGFLHNENLWYWMKPRE